jgi:hypothetical protein
LSSLATLFSSSIKSAHLLKIEPRYSAARSTPQNTLPTERVLPVCPNSTDRILSFIRIRVQSMFVTGFYVAFHFQDYLQAFLFHYRDFEDNSSVDEAKKRRSAKGVS